MWGNLSETKSYPIVCIHHEYEGFDNFRCNICSFEGCDYCLRQHQETKHVCGISSGLRYDIGASKNTAKMKLGYIPLDHEDFDIRNTWPIENNSVEALNLSHILEHVEYGKAKFVLGECYRVLKENAIADIYVPNGRLIGMFLLLGLSNSGIVKVQGYGNQENEWQYHKNVFCSSELKRLCEKVGFKQIYVNSSDKSKRQGGRGSHPGFNIGHIITWFIKPELHIRAIK